MEKSPGDASKHIMVKFATYWGCEVKQWTKMTHHHSITKTCAVKSASG